MTQFSQAEQRFRELEDGLIRGELTEDDFLLKVSQLRVVGEDGRRWMLSGRSGRWLVHDGTGWVFADPAAGSPGAGPATSALAPVSAGVGLGAGKADVPLRSARPSVPRWLVSGAVALLSIACLVGLGAASWVLFLRDLGEGGPTPSGEAAVGLMVTYTPRPATATYTPTFTPTPSRTPTSTVTPIRTATPIPTATSVPTMTPLPSPPTPEPSPSPTLVPTAVPSPASTPGPMQAYVVQKGDTLFEIAMRFKVSLEALAAANGITNPKLIRPGQVLVIPQPGVTPQAATKTPTPTWTPLVLGTRTPTPTKSSSTPKPSPTPTKKAATPTPSKTATPKPSSLTGKVAFAIWNPFLGSGKYELFVSQIDGAGKTLIGTGYRQPQFSADGTTLVVNGDRNQAYEHLNVLGAGGEVLREISRYSEDAFPSWSPDGQQVVYSSTAYRDGRTLLGVVTNQYAKEWQWIPYGNGQLEGSYPFWMADGRLVYSGCSFWSGGGNCGLYVVDSRGGTPQRLTEHDSDTAAAGFQSRVAFMSGRDGNWEIYTVNMDGSGLKRLTNNGAEDGLPAWSPDGRSIAFVSRRDGSWAMWVMNSDGSSQRKLFDLGGGYGTGEYEWTRERISWAP